MKILYILILLIIGNECLAQNTNNDVKVYTDSSFWNAFQGNTDIYDPLKECHLEIGFQMDLVKLNVVTGKPKFKSTAIVLTDLSWVKSGCKTERNKKYLQTIYALAELYSMDLENQFNKKFYPVNDKLESKVNIAINKYKEQLKTELEIFDKESDFGKIDQKVNEWQVKIGERKKNKNNNR
jgi:hypothetical protein